VKYYTISDRIIAFSTNRGCTDKNDPYDGFNITWYTDDNPHHVANCRNILCNKLNITDERLILPRQVHKAKVVEVTEDNVSNQFIGVDALTTALPQTCIGISTADCVPLLFYDTQKQAIAAAHAGWRGTVLHIGRKTIETMQMKYDTNPEDVQVIIGPSIGPMAFEVGDEVYNAFADANFDTEEIAYKQANKWHIDLWKANALDLELMNIPANNILIAGICTYEHYDQYFSARRLGIKSGRIYTGIMIK